LAVNPVEQAASTSYQNQIDDITAKILKLEEILDTLHPTE